MLNTVRPTFLHSFVGERLPYVVGDDVATNYRSAAAIFVAIVASRSTSIRLLSTHTGFPKPFIKAVLLMIKSGGWLVSVELADLIVSIHKKEGNPVQGNEEIACALGYLMENVWITTNYNSALAQCIACGLPVRRSATVVEWWVHDEDEL